MVPDPKWLEILKVSGWQTGAIAAAAALLIYANNRRLLPTPLEPWIVQAAVIALFVCGCLSLASIASATVRAAKGPKRKFLEFVAVRVAKHKIEDEIATLTPMEREIIGYLLANNQNMFTNTPDGGHATTLISKGIVACALVPGQMCTHYEVPFQVPDYVWDVLMKHKAEFPYTPPKEHRPLPWRTHWM